MLRAKERGGASVAGFRCVAGFREPLYWTLFIDDLDISTAAQSSQYIGTLLGLNFNSSSITSMGSTSNLTSLETFHLYNCNYLTTVPSINSSSINQFYIWNAANLTTVNGPLPTSNLQCGFGLWNAPLLTSLPSLANVTLLASLTLFELGLTSLPTFPAPGIHLTYLNITNLPSLNSAPSDLSMYPLVNVTLSRCPNLPSNLIPTFNTSKISNLDFSYNLLTTLPPWICNLTGPNSVRLYLSNNLLVSLPDCFGTLDINLLDLQFAIQANSWIPQGIFIMPQLQTLLLAGIGTPLINSTLQSTPWNLTGITSLSLPSQYLAAGVPPPGSNISLANGNLSLSFFGPSINSSAPDSYFLSFSRLYNLSLTGINVTGTIPSSLQNCTALTLLELSSNSLSGAFPAFLLALPSLQTLNLSNNLLNGSLPAQIINITSIVDLNMSNNDFTLCSTPTLAFQTNASCTIGGICTGCTPSQVAFTNCTPICDSTAPISPPPVNFAL